MLKKTAIFSLAMLFVMTSFTGCLSDDEEKTQKEKIIVAYEVKEDYANPDENPQVMADYLAKELDMDIELYPVTSEGAIIEALRFGNAHIAFMDGAAAWIGWQQYGLEALAADQKTDGRTYYNAHAVVLKGSEIANAYLDNDESTDPFALLEGKTSCHTGWLKSAGMLLPMGFLIGNGYADVVGDADDIESLRDTVYNFFNENASIPESGTTYYSYSGAVRCLSEGVGDVAFAKDSTVAGYCGNENTSDNEEWCLPEEDYILLPSYGSAPSHPVMFNPDFMDAETQKEVQDALVGMNDSTEGTEILENILGTPGITATDANTHLGSYGGLIEDIPGISNYFNSKFDIGETTA
jgi:ABC-type phosphate/phosphonate transport system substrate-binding protein|tara:strand:+ start:1121 stop:2176 length:1056 start_codon:yes stop_codon:yes gene_type:complete